MSVVGFENALKSAPFKFPNEYIKDIIEDAPKSDKKDIMYRYLDNILRVKPLTLV